MCKSKGQIPLYSRLLCLREWHGWHGNSTLDEKRLRWDLFGNELLLPAWNVRRQSEEMNAAVTNTILNLENALCLIWRQTYFLNTITLGLCKGKSKASLKGGTKTN